MRALVVLIICWIINTGGALAGPVVVSSSGDPDIYARYAEWFARWFLPNNASGLFLFETEGAAGPVVTRIDEPPIPDSDLENAPQPDSICRAMFPPGQTVICSDPYLSRLNHTLAVQLTKTLDGSPPARRDDIEQDQEEWKDSVARLCMDDKARLKHRPLKDCLKFAYYERISALRSNIITGREVREVCEYVLKRGSAIRDDFVDRVNRDANNDGRTDWIDIADVPFKATVQTVARLIPDTTTGPKIIDDEDDGPWFKEEYGEWFEKDSIFHEIAWVEIAGRIFLLRAVDENFADVTTLSYIGQDNGQRLACAFVPTWTEHIQAVRPEDERVCAALSVGKVQKIDLDPSSDEEKATDGNNAGSVTVDWENSGRLTKLWLKHFIMSPPPYDDEVETENFWPSPEIGSSIPQPLSQLQTFGYVWNKLQWFVFEGRTYLDEVEWAPIPDRHVRTMQAGEAREVCRAHYDKSVRLHLYRPVNY